MTKAELISALEWFKDDAELHIVVPHPVIETLMEVYPVSHCRMRLMPSRFEIVAGSTDPTSPEPK